MPSEQLYPSSKNNQFEVDKQNHHFGDSPRIFRFEPVHIIYDPRILRPKWKNEMKILNENWNPQKSERLTLSELGEPFI